MLFDMLRQYFVMYFTVSFLVAKERIEIKVITIKAVLSGHSKKDQNGLQYRLSLNAGQKYCRMLHLEHSAILSTFIKLPFSINTFVLSIVKWPPETRFTVLKSDMVI